MLSSGMAFDTTIIAVDEANRYIDADGRLHVRLSHISKATVNGYLGSEIPDASRLGLEPGRVYQLLRDPGELTRGAPTSNNIQLLRRHIAVSADDPKKDDVVGSTGTDADFADPYLDNSLVIWDAEAIAGVDTREKVELSCAYRYVADMTPGTYQGLRYDGIMRNIVFNHVALVEAGRAGSDVLVADSKPEDAPMSTAAITSKKALMVRGALAAYARPILAADAKLDMNSILAGVNRANYVAKIPDISARFTKAVKGKLAEDAKLDGLPIALDAMKDEDCGEDDEMDAEDGEEDDDKPADDEEETDAEKKAKAAKEALAAARDTDPDPLKAGKAMDAKIKLAADAAAKTAETNTIARMNAIFEAKAAVRPYVGDVVVAMDSAEAVYRFALDHLGIETKDIKEVSALRTILQMAPKPGSNPPVSRMAQDSANDDFSKRYPNASRIGHA